MLKAAAIAVGLLTSLTAIAVVMVFSDDVPKMDVAVAGKVFERYPHWQRSVVASREVVLDTQFSSVGVGGYQVPQTVPRTSLRAWQKRAQEPVVMEFGIGRLSEEAARK